MDGNNITTTHRTKRPMLLLGSFHCWKKKREESKGEEPRSSSLCFFFFCRRSKGNITFHGRRGLMLVIPLYTNDRGRDRRRRSRKHGCFHPARRAKSPPRRGRCRHHWSPRALKSKLFLLMLVISWNFHCTFFMILLLPVCLVMCFSDYNSAAPKRVRRLHETT